MTQTSLVKVNILPCQFLINQSPEIGDGANELLYYLGHSAKYGNAVITRVGLEALIPGLKATRSPLPVKINCYTCIFT
jgi:hypothetical protein